MMHSQGQGLKAWRFQDRVKLAPPHRAQAVRHHQRGAPGHEARQRGLHRRLAGGVQRRRRLVEDEHGRVLEQRPRYGNPLPLPSAQRQPPLPYLRVVAVGQPPRQRTHRHRDRGGRVTLRYVTRTRTRGGWGGGDYGELQQQKKTKRNFVNVSRFCFKNTKFVWAIIYHEEKQQFKTKTGF